MDYQIRKVGNAKKVGIPKDKDYQDLVWYKRDELKEFSNEVLHIRNTGKFLDGHAYQVALALSPVTRNEIKQSDLIGIEVIKTNYKDARPQDKKCNYVAVTQYKRWEFSVIKGLTYLFQGESALLKKRKDNAFRNAIKPQIVSFRQKHLEEHCRNYGNIQWHVDHVYPFCEMVKDFLFLYQIDINDIETETDLTTGGDVLKSEKILRQWQRYHYENARLEFKTPEENIRKGAKILK